MSGAYGNPIARRVTQQNVEITTAWTALPTTAKEGRQWIEIYNRSSKKIFLSVDDSTANVKFVKAIAGGDYKIEPIGDSLTLYARTAAGGARVIVTEYA